MQQSLYARLAVVLLVVFALIGFAFMAIARFSTEMYYQEVTQKLNADIAMYVVQEELLIQNGRVNREGLGDLAHTVMIVNPSVEVYLLDLAGNILGYEAPDEKILRRQVSLQPIGQFLSADGVQLPLLGDDPRSQTDKKIFTVAPVIDNGAHVGYLYAILGGEKYDATAKAFLSSYILKLAAFAILASLLFAFIAALLMFGFLTQRLRSLTASVEAFEHSEILPDTDTTSSGDEIDRLDDAFRRMASRIAHQINAIRRMDGLRRELVTNVSHDLRTPLASMQGYIETLQLKGNSLSEAEKQHYLQIAARHGEQLNRLVAQLFELSRLDSESIEPVREPFSLSELIQDVAQKFQLEADKKGIFLQVPAEPSLGLVNADIAMIERVFENLIENALRYTPEQGKIQVLANSDANQVTVEIADTGSGIDEAELPHVFDRLYRADNVGSSGSGMRSGLGLAIVKRILELHDSAITVASRAGRGTCFRFALTRADNPR